MTSNDEVNHSQNQPSKTQNGATQMKYGGSMLQGSSTPRKPNRSNHNMGLKRQRSVDSLAGMCSTDDKHSILFSFKMYFSFKK